MCGVYGIGCGGVGDVTPVRTCLCVQFVLCWTECVSSLPATDFRVFACLSLKRAEALCLEYTYIVDTHLAQSGISVLQSSLALSEHHEI